MSARSNTSKAEETTVVTMPRAEKPAEAPMPPVEAIAAPAVPKKRNGRRMILMFGVPLVLVVGGGYFYLNGGRYEDTDNANIEQAKVSLSADISGRITGVNVNENQTVAAGAVLFTIDPAPYQIALDQANAALASARVNVAQLKVAYGTAQATLKSAQATLQLRQDAFDRKNTLVQQGNASDATLDDVKLSLQQAQSALDLANQQVAAATAALGGNPDIVTDQHPAVLSAMAAVEAAQRNLTKTTVVAPADGIVANVANLNVGQFIATGTTIATLVETGSAWVVANYKETQLEGLKVGQPAEIHIDAYSGKLEGTVESIGAATGSEFALIPAQNATGNWVKVGQRVPVRIALNAGDDQAQVLRSGMSASVAVDTGKTTLDKLLGR